MSEIDKKRPVNKPRPRVQLGKGWFGCGGICGGRGGQQRCRRPRIDEFPEAVKLLKSNVPSCNEDIRGEFTPMSRRVQVIVGRQNAEMVQVVSGTAVVSIRILEFSKVVQCSYLLQRYLSKK